MVSIMYRKYSSRRGLWLFFLFLLLCTALFDTLLLFTQSITILFLINGFCVMWTPALASGVARRLNHEDWHDLSFRWHTRTVGLACLFAVLFPLVIGLLAYGLAWVSHLTPLLAFHATGDLAAFVALANTTSPIIRAGLMLLYLTILAIIAAAGEEIGWRGYMLPRMLESKLPGTVILSGLIWGFWHWPQILFSPPVAGMPQIVTACIFLVTITMLGCVSAWLRIRSGSMWPPIILHAAWNAIIVELFNAFTPGTDTSLWTGEAGILVACTMLLVVGLLYTLFHPTTHKV
jgi:Predicted protease of the Abi (CAAX) family